MIRLKMQGRLINQRFRDFNAPLYTYQKNPKVRQVNYDTPGSASKYFFERQLLIAKVHTVTRQTMTYLGNYQLEK